jgi:tetratricopeptide (TPR) repeat protein
MKRKSVYSFVSAVVSLFILIISISTINAAENNYELFIAQGIEKIGDRQYSEALELFQKALTMAPEDTEALYYTAVAYTRLGELDKAEELFLKIEDTSSVPNVDFELGRIYYVKADCDKTSSHLSKFVSSSDDESLIDYANSLMKDCLEPDVAEEEKPYRLNVTVGAQYDDNVTVEPNNPILPEDQRQEDGMIITYLDAGADLLNKGKIKIKADYSFYHNFHFDLNDYNIQYHKVSPSVEIQMTDIITPAIGYTYEYTSFGGDSYSQVNTFFTSVLIREGKEHSTDVIYKYRDLDYDDTDLFTDNGIRTGHQNLIGIMQNYEADKLKADVYYFDDRTRADADYWAYNGFKLGADINYQATEDLYLTVSAQYSKDKYRDDFPSFTEHREDKTQQYTEDYTSNDSNLDTFEYDRNVIGLLLTVALL